MAGIRCGLSLGSTSGSQRGNRRPPVCGAWSTTPRSERRCGGIFTRRRDVCRAPTVEDDLMQAPTNNFQTMIWASAEKLESSLDRPAHLHEIALELGLSLRTLRAHCRKHLGVSPLRYLWLRRMVNAREELRRPVQESTVTEIAMRNHFTELGRFSVAYRRMFGESPSATLRRARADLCEENQAESMANLIIGYAICQFGAAHPGHQGVERR
jgi:AraC-like DNA-binding protein